jgi:hypothetical protein
LFSVDPNVSAWQLNFANDKKIRLLTHNPETSTCRQEASALCSAADLLEP